MCDPNRRRQGEGGVRGEDVPLERGAIAPAAGTGSRRRGARGLPGGAPRATRGRLRSFEQGRVVAAMAGSLLAARAVRCERARHRLARGDRPRCSPSSPVALALRGTELAAYHGAEHISIGSYEHDEPRPREHERCGSHMLGPLLVSTAVGNARRQRARLARRADGRRPHRRRNRSASPLSAELLLAGCCAIRSIR